MSNEKSGLLPLQSAVPSALAELLKRTEMSREKMSFAWRAAVGNGLARAATVQLRSRGVIEVTAADERWRREIERSASIILARLESLLGKGIVTRLHVVSKGSDSRAPKLGPRTNDQEPGTKG